MVTEQVKPSRVDENGFGSAIAKRDASVEVASTRAAQEVQAAMAIAKRFPRDETAAFNRITQACKRKMLAEGALYAYPKGGQTVTGPSIRLAEMLAQNWGNLDFGVIELEQRKGESTMMSYAWDLETNTRQTKIFNVKHERHTRSGSYALTDPREVYELTANQGARRLRSCILGVIPGDVVDAAVIECEKTMAGNNAEPLVGRLHSMVTAFADLSVNQDMIEKRLGHKVEVTTEAELVNLKKIYRSLRDNMADRADFFEVGNSQAGNTKLDDILANKKNGAGNKRPAPPVDSDTQLPEDEAERIINEAAEKARNGTGSSDSPSSAHEQNDARGGGEGEQEQSQPPDQFEVNKSNLFDKMYANKHTPETAQRAWEKFLVRYKNCGGKNGDERKLPEAAWPIAMKAAEDNAGDFASPN